MNYLQKDSSGFLDKNQLRELRTSEIESYEISAFGRVRSELSFFDRELTFLIHQEEIKDIEIEEFRAKEQKRIEEGIKARTAYLENLKYTDYKKYQDTITEEELRRENLKQQFLEIEARRYVIGKLIEVGNAAGSLIQSMQDLESEINTVQYELNSLGDSISALTSVISDSHSQIESFDSRASDIDLSHFDIPHTNPTLTYNDQFSEPGSSYKRIKNRDDEDRKKLYEIDEMASEDVKGGMKYLRSDKELAMSKINFHNEEGREYYIERIRYWENFYHEKKLRKK